jgi:hypothetical protein
MLLVVATLLLAGCCTGFLCELEEMDKIERQWEGSRDAAGNLWEGERDRTEKTPTGRMLPDTTEAPTGEPPDSIPPPSGGTVA